MSSERSAKRVSVGFSVKANAPACDGRCAVTHVPGFVILRLTVKASLLNVISLTVRMDEHLASWRPEAGVECWKPTSAFLHLQQLRNSYCTNFTCAKTCIRATLAAVLGSYREIPGRNFRPERSRYGGNGK